MCNKCNAKGIEPPKINKNAQHTYCHCLVRCKSLPKTTETVPTEERITTLEDKVLVLDDKITRIEEYLVRMESTLGLLLSKLGNAAPAA